MAGREEATNERIVTLLRDVLRELKDVKVRQQHIETSLEKMAKAAR